MGVRSIGFLYCACRRHSDSIEVTPAVLVPSAFDGALRRHTVAGFDFPLYRLAEQSFLPFLRFCVGGCGLSLGALGNHNDSCRFGLTALARERFIQRGNPASAEYLGHSPSHTRHSSQDPWYRAKRALHGIAVPDCDGAFAWLPGRASEKVERGEGHCRPNAAAGKNRYWPCRFVVAQFE